jgi:hypothetical protein
VRRKEKPGDARITKDNVMRQKQTRRNSNLGDERSKNETRAVRDVRTEAFKTSDERAKQEKPLK